MSIYIYTYMYINTFYHISLLSLSSSPSLTPYFSLCLSLPPSLPLSLFVPPSLCLSSSLPPLSPSRYPSLPPSTSAA